MTRLWHIIHQVFKGNYRGQTTVINRKPRKSRNGGVDQRSEEGGNVTAQSLGD